MRINGVRSLEEILLFLGLYPFGLWKVLEALDALTNEQAIRVTTTSMSFRHGLHLCLVCLDQPTPGLPVS